jgi:hypothetical protein
LNGNDRDLRLTEKFPTFAPGGPDYSATATPDQQDGHLGDLHAEHAGLTNGELANPVIKREMHPTLSPVGRRGGRGMSHHHCVAADHWNRLAQVCLSLTLEASMLESGGWPRVLNKEHTI